VVVNQTCLNKCFKWDAVHHYRKIRKKPDHVHRLKRSSKGMLAEDQQTTLHGFKTIFEVIIKVCLLKTHLCALLALRTTPHITSQIKILL